MAEAIPFSPEMAEFKAPTTGFEQKPEKTGGLLEWAKRRIDHLREVFKRTPQSLELCEGMLQKITEQFGSNQGGWYEHQKTSERFYVKLYDSPDRARTEFIANRIYEKLGIKAASSQLLEMGGQLAVASQEIPGSKGTTREEQQTHEDVRGGFVADAYLANWDVVGLCHDNIVRGADGGMYRIDNGGSLNFRARGEQKDFNPSAIPELESMRNPEYPAGQVFAGLSEEEMAAQARDLVEKITKKDIAQIVRQSGLRRGEAQAISQALKGRRQFLIERFGLAEAEQLPTFQEIWQKLAELNEQLAGTGLRSRYGLPADKDKIEGQQIDLIDATDRGRYEITFKLSSFEYERFLRNIAYFYDNFKPETGKIVYDGKETGGEFAVADCWLIEREGLKVQIATPSDFNASRAAPRAALGLVRIEIPPEAHQGVPIEELQEKLKKILAEVFQVPEGMSSPDQESERKYKQARYLWHHKLQEEDFSPNALEPIESRLKRKEVFPGYFTVVEPGKHQEYQKISAFAVYHQVSNPNLIPSILKTGGLMSSHERYRRGLIVSGMSSDMDFESGGADSVFTRIVTRAGVKKARYAGYLSERVFLVFKPEILDRTDWYAYNTDNFGRTNPEIFSQRQSPKEVFQAQATNGFVSNNEQMFRMGIPVEMIAAIVCGKSYVEGNVRKKLIERLKEAGLNEINGQRVEDFVVATGGGANFKHLIRITQKRSHGLSKRGES